MKIVIANDNEFAHYYERMSWCKAFKFANYDAFLWNIKQKSIFDMFDEIKPDLVFLQGYNLTPGVVSLLEEYPETKLVIRVSDWSEWNNKLNREKYPVLKAGEEEIKLLTAIQKLKNPLLLHTHHHPDWLKQTHGFWIANGFDIISIMNCADVFSYCNGKYQENLDTDIVFIGGYWPYKAQKLDKWILPLTQKHKMRIFGNQSWPTSKYCGFIPEEQTRHVLKSAKVCPSIHEPHSTEFGYDIVTRPFNLLANKCLCVSDYVEGLYKLFPQEISYARRPDEFQEKINFFIKNPLVQQEYVEEGFQKVIQKHTAFDRMLQVLDFFQLDTQQLTDAKQRFIDYLGINL